ncbi:putative choline transporter, neither null mutation nor overexpression affects choline transport [Coemansia biformis]|uniref:Protein PNS1 n=1 Tax=Coemansia biformis TaxID=1286918 RepID=A0A9W7YFK9_9FUNG|nr:putative choline transporter, neither null mutation nor overexpression affects choline transport [Coemansia biformis]
MSYGYGNSYYPPQGGYGAPPQGGYGAPPQGGYEAPPPPPEQHQYDGYGGYSDGNYQQQQQQPPPPAEPYYPPPQDQAAGAGDDFKGAKKFVREPKFRDLWAALLFLAQLALFVVMAALFINSLPSSTFKNPGGPHPTKNFYSQPTMIMWLCVLLVSIVFSVLYLGLMQMFARQMLVISFWFAVVSMIGTGIYYLSARIWFAGAIMLIFGVMYALMWFSWRHRLPFSKLVLETVCHITRRFPSTIVVSLGFLLVQAAYSALWSLAFVGSFKYMDKYQHCTTHTDRNGRQYQSCTNVPQILSWVFMVFSFYWTSGVIINVLHTTICGTFATFYFFEGSPYGYPTKHVTLSSLKRAMTTSFGSICFGSLIVAIIQTIRAIVRAFRSQNDDNLAAQLIGCCLDCILGCIEGIVEFFNKYAYVEIAVYGKPFVQAAKDTWTLVKDRGIDALINDSLIGNVLQMGAFMCASVVALVAWLYITITKPEYNATGSYTVPIIIAAFLLAMSMFTVLLKCIDSGAATTFVCLAEDPGTMARNNPRLFAMVAEAYPQVVRGVRTPAAF